MTEKKRSCYISIQSTNMKIETINLIILLLFLEKIIIVQYLLLWTHHKILIQRKNIQLVKQKTMNW